MKNSPENITEACESQNFPILRQKIYILLVASQNIC